MREIIGNRISSKLFTFSRNVLTGKCTFVTERSTFDAAGGLRQLYQDSCDVGFVMVSEKTGQEAVFGLSHVEMNRDSDVVYWELAPLYSTVRKNRGLSNCTVKIFNT